MTRSVWPRRGAQEQHADAPLPPLPPPRAADPVKTLTYALDVSQKLVVSRTFRSEVLRLVIRLYEGVPTPDYAAICQCLTFLDDPAEVAKIIHSLLSGSGEGRGLGQAQCVSAHPWRCCTHHARGVCAARPPTRGAAASRAPCSGPGAACLPDCFRPGGQRDAELYGQGARKGGVGLASPCGQPGSAARLVHGVAVCGTLLAPRGLLPFMCAQVKAQLESLSPGSSGAGGATPAVAAGGEGMEVEGAGAAEPAAGSYAERHAHFSTVLSGDVPIELERQFLARHNHADLQILKNIKATVENRNRCAARAWSSPPSDGRA